MQVIVDRYNCINISNVNKPYCRSVNNSLLQCTSNNSNECNVVISNGADVDANICRLVADHGPLK